MRGYSQNTPFPLACGLPDTCDTWPSASVGPVGPGTREKAFANVLDDGFSAGGAPLASPGCREPIGLIRLVNRQR